MKSNYIYESLNSVHFTVKGEVLPYPSDILYQIPETLSVDEFVEQANELVFKTGIIIIRDTINISFIDSTIEKINSPVVLFYKDGDKVFPLIYRKTGKGESKLTLYTDSGSKEFDKIDDVIHNIILANDRVIYAYPIVKTTFFSKEDEKEHLRPIDRLMKMLYSERKDVINVYTYGVLAGLLNLTLPVAIQMIVNLISGGRIFNTIYLLIGIVIFMILIVGGIQLMQIYVVELLQRRIYTKAAVEFAFRVPRVKLEAIKDKYLPELMNRFFDVLTLQKGLPKLLIDISTSAFQIFFGLLLLSFYHYSFIFFALFIALFVYVIFRATGEKGLKYSIYESKHKYKLVNWLEEIARSITAFKMAGTSPITSQVTANHINNYLINRKRHFSVLMRQYGAIILFKAAVIGGLLILGSILVAQRQITLGQFVASELILILILTAIEKFIGYLDIVYDILTGVDKIGHVTDLELESTSGLELDHDYTKGVSVKVEKLSYFKPEVSTERLNNLAFQIEPGEKVSILSVGNSGKAILSNILSGIYTEYTGNVFVDDYPLKEVQLNLYRDRIAKNLSREDLFEGTVFQNITIGKADVSYKDVMDVVNDLGFTGSLFKSNDGLRTHISPKGHTIDNSIKDKIILARCIIKKPRLFILNDFFDHFMPEEKENILNYLVDKNKPWTLMVITTDEKLTSYFDKKYLLKEGKISDLDTNNKLGTADA